MITARILWAMVPDWLRLTGAVAVVLIGVYAAGHHIGGKAEQQRQSEKRIETLETVDDLKQEARDETDDDLSRSISEP